jgi:hypothetical protein
VVPASDLRELQDDGYKLVKIIPCEWLMKDSTGDFNIQSVLEKHGFAVISGVLSSEECENCLNLAWDWIRAASAVEQASAENLNQVQLQAIYDAIPSPESLLDSEYFPRCVEGGELRVSSRISIARLTDPHPVHFFIGTVLKKEYCHFTDPAILRLPGQFARIRKSRPSSNPFMERLI